MSLAAAVLAVVLLAEELLTGASAARAVLVAAIASTAFVLFITPHSDSPDPRHVLGGHLLALVVGSLMVLVMDWSVIGDWLSDYDAAFAVSAAVGVGLMMFVMAATNTEHPPAAGTALGSRPVRDGGSADPDGIAPGVAVQDGRPPLGPATRCAPRR